MFAGAAALVVLFSSHQPAISDDARKAGSQTKSVAGRTLGGAVDGSPMSGCSCRYKGKDVMLGESICMKTNNGFVKAQCSRYLNNTSWTITRTPCTIS
ncbi:MAG: hypothetical protein ACR2O4_14450 [Hyphomicrobiaceae bacterium]